MRVNLGVRWSYTIKCKSLFKGIPCMVLAVPVIFRQPGEHSVNWYFFFRPLKHDNGWFSSTKFLLRINSNPQYISHVRFWGSQRSLKLSNQTQPLPLNLRSLTLGTVLCSDVDHRLHRLCGWTELRAKCAASSRRYSQWFTSPVVCFRQLEAQFAFAGVTTDTTRLSFSTKRSSD